MGACQNDRKLIRIRTILDKIGDHLGDNRCNFWKAWLDGDGDPIARHKSFG